CIEHSRITQPCMSDNVAEDYLTPADHPIVVRLAGNIAAGATCDWTFDDGDGPTRSVFACTEVINIRVRYGRTTHASVDVAVGGEPTQHLVAEIAVRDLLIAGLGDSIASGE